MPREETEAIAPHLAFFQRLVAMIRKSGWPTRPASRAADSDQRDIDAAVRQVIGGAVDAGEVIDLFAAAGLDAARLDILSEDFLQRVSALEQKNLALETLRKLLNDQIKVSERTNLVQAQKFREALEEGDARLHEQADHYGRDDRAASGAGEMGPRGAEARAGTRTERRRDGVSTTRWRRTGRPKK